MSWNRDRGAGHAAVVADLRKREDAAPRLCSEVPRLRTLRLQLQDQPATEHMGLRGYVKPVVVATAPAHFEVRCMEPRCDGYHDLTDDLMAGLRRARTRFSGESPCHGLVGDVGCGRVLHFVVEATYDDAVSDVLSVRQGAGER